MHVPVPSSRPQGSEGTPPIRVPWLSRLLARDARVGIRRAIGDLLAGRPIVVAAPGATDRLVVPVESLDAAGLAALHEAGAPTLVVSATRAAALGGLAEVSEIALPRALGPHALMA
ncbi:MAG: hypothetical protein ACK50I_07035, partial [Burkholderiales bacterium]